MADRAPEPNDPLGPYRPSALPGVPGDGRTWFARLLLIVVLLGAASNRLARRPS